MAFMRETKGSISLYFIIAGALGAYLGFNDFSQIWGTFEKASDLSPVGNVYLVMELFFMAAAVTLFIIGIKYESIVKGAPYFVPGLLVALTVLKFLAGTLFPQLLVNAVLSVLLFAYLFFQNRRITKEILSG